jgi:hypothetical protein
MAAALSVKLIARPRLQRTMRIHASYMADSPFHVACLVELSEDTRVIESERRYLVELTVKRTPRLLVCAVRVPAGRLHRRHRQNPESRGHASGLTPRGRAPRPLHGRRRSAGLQSEHLSVFIELSGAHEGSHRPSRAIRSSTTGQSARKPSTNTGSKSSSSATICQSRSATSTK